jgi:hypothetical protein
MTYTKGLRHILPVCFTVLYAVLMLSAWRQEEAARHRPAVESMDDMYMPPYNPPRAAQWALGLNLPAVVASLPTLWIVSRIAPHTNDPLVYAIIGFFVPLLWFLVGRWLDRRIGLLPPRPEKQTSAFAIAGLAALLFLDGFLIFAVMNAEVYQGKFTMISMAAWLSFAAFCLYLRIRRQPVVPKAA